MKSGASCSAWTPGRHLCSSRRKEEEAQHLQPALVLSFSPLLGLRVKVETDKMVPGPQTQVLHFEGTESVAFSVQMREPGSGEGKGFAWGPEDLGREWTQNLASCLPAQSPQSPPRWVIQRPSGIMVWEGEDGQSRARERPSPAPQAPVCFTRSGWGHGMIRSHSFSRGVGR